MRNEAMDLSVNEDVGLRYVNPAYAAGSANTIKVGGLGV